MKNENMTRLTEVRDVEEFIQLLGTLSHDEKNQIMGIMIGLQMARESA